MTDTTEESNRLARFLREHPRLVVLTGAGISLDSGIPAYRDSLGKWLPGPPIQERDFTRDPHTRRRYWTRSWYGWPRIRDARPNDAHHALAQLEQLGHVDLLVTQNVDGLHGKAGSRAVVDLHGRVDTVRCLECGQTDSRDAVQAQLARDNSLPELPASEARPDGDQAVPDQLIAGLALPRCRHCEGDVRPDVVFFGGSVPRPRVNHCEQALSAADALLVVGSSLTVFSGFRFCRQAQREGKPLAIINPGDTRADEMASLRLRGGAGPLLREATRALADH